MPGRLTKGPFKGPSGLSFDPRRTLTSPSACEIICQSFWESTSTVPEGSFRRIYRLAWRHGLPLPEMERAIEPRWDQRDTGNPRKQGASRSGLPSLSSPMKCEWKRRVYSHRQLRANRSFAGRRTRPASSSPSDARRHRAQTRIPNAPGRAPTVVRRMPGIILGLVRYKQADFMASVGCASTELAATGAAVWPRWAS